MQVRTALNREQCRVTCQWFEIEGKKLTDKRSGIIYIASAGLGVEKTAGQIQRPKDLTGIWIATNINKLVFGQARCGFEPQYFVPSQEHPVIGLTAALVNARTAIRAEPQLPQ